MKYFSSSFPIPVLQQYIYLHRFHAVNRGRPRNLDKGLPLQPVICALQHPIKLSGIKVNDHVSKGGIPSGNMSVSV